MARVGQGLHGRHFTRTVASLGDEAGDSPVGGGFPTGGDPASLARLACSPATTNPTLSGFPGFLVSYQPPPEPHLIRCSYLLLCTIDASKASKLRVLTPPRTATVRATEYHSPSK